MEAKTQFGHWRLKMNNFRRIMKNAVTDFTLSNTTLFYSSAVGVL